ncbi:Na(+)-translocating NADH-quinone reductase subunit A [Crocinitomix catalasitica]|uniref:Na(+)-translocating NADH-quinone reductase subunit A n=1 Tax=Crocinitomix catalasitica TaxID=184607 RepID=UPI000481F9A9|nr:Na(+)-translocating NADH-quinone reductase subunit A [Crocinitomix catalasitica]
MSKTIKIRKGLDIKLIGEADKVKATVSAPIFAIKPPDFHGLVPKMTVKAGDKVKAGSIIFTNKYQEEVKFVSPISGEIAEIVRGEKRRILAVTIKPDASNEAESFGKIDPSNMDGEAVKAALLANGFWPFIKMRPLDIVANPYDKPKAIFVSAFDSSPLAPDYDYILHGENDAFQAGLTALSKLTEGKVHLTVRSDMNIDSTFTSAKGVQINKINSKHPAGNVGTQIHHIDPINKNEIVWTVNAIDVALIGRSLLAGQFDGSRTVALTGSEVKKPKYIKTAIGANIAAIIEDNIEGDNVRYISGNVLTGDKVETTGFLGFYHNHVTVIPEGNESKFMITKGWLSPGLSKFSINRSYFSWLMPNKKYNLDTNLNGEVRSFVVTGEMEKVFPFDIYPMQLVKATMYNDIDLMENLGIYEVAPEDFALCEFVCTSKVSIQKSIRGGLDVIQEECM